MNPRFYVVARDPRRAHSLRGHQTVKRRGEKVDRVIYQRGFRLRLREKNNKIILMVVTCKQYNKYFIHMPR